MKKPSELERQLHQHLDRSVEQLPADTEQRLAQARQAALNAACSDRVIELPVRRQRLTTPAWGIAASVLLAMPLWWSINQSPPSSQELTAPQLSGLDFITTLAELSDDDVDVADDLEFALWLLEQDMPADRG
ncbi:hypothetical protein CHH28_01505 [Bacterioplanes sanyensis]|uniref:Uncharacterized protein n=1 Tax=Bacterioplanes sanyensis TaxID=1249553 RepID=A0A222FGR3_9GAMM|nr:DUF3619 family protein [Bacterioplanes sanyensis]ASP37433.1 hypothetical protein CHH28_01505 [Bacterioplanes sanyensis]